MDQPPRARPDLGDTSEVDALVAALALAGDDLASTPVPAEVAERQLAAIVSLAAEHAHTVPAVTAVGTRPRRVRRVLGLTAVKLGLAAGVAAAMAGGLAATGSLPDPVQRVVSDGAGRVGIHLPSPADPVLPDEADDRGEERADLPTLPAPTDPLEGDLERDPPVPGEPEAPPADVSDDPPRPDDAGDASDQASEPRPRPADPVPDDPDTHAGDPPDQDETDGSDTERGEAPGRSGGPGTQTSPDESAPDRPTAFVLNSSDGVPKEPAGRN